MLTRAAISANGAEASVYSGMITGHSENGYREVAPGASWCILGDVEHSAEALEDCEVVEVFAPLREEYLPPT